MAAALVQSYRYAEPSIVEREGRGSRLVLATSSPGDEAPNPFFFAGTIVAPKRVAEGMLLVARVARTRFYVPPAMLAKILAAADPVVTCTKESVRFESFSACAGVYARFDLGRDAFDVEHASPGTTNVDFNPEMRAVLAKTRVSDAFRLSVGREVVKVDTSRAGAIERKVPLPVRWIKSFGEVQAILASMTPRLRIDAAQARKFLKALPKTSRGSSWVVRAGPGLRLSQVATKEGVEAGGLHRLGVLADAANEAQELVVYGDDHGSSAWELVLPDARLSIVLSPEAYRGFSGEGQLLLDLAGDRVDAAVAAVRAQLRWQTKIDPTAFGLDADTAARALAVLASRGVVGYDLAAGAFFHRELPFDVGDAESLHPRLEAARRLVAAGAVTKDGRVAASGGGSYEVKVTDDSYSCTCAWFSKHGDSRGPCKHVLAMSLQAEESL
ncbi:MAG: SWIM zinc finger family protein [Labilithrix sp.]